MPMRRGRASDWLTAPVICILRAVRTPPALGGLLTITATLMLIALPRFQGARLTPAEGAKQSGMGSGGGITRNSPGRRTVGVVDGRAAAVFEDVTAKTSVGRFRNRCGGPEKDYIPETITGGVAILDYDNDGLPDIYLLNGSTFDAIRGKENPPKAALYHNLGDWRFEDVTDRAGVANERWGVGVAVGDYDNDGWLDMFVSNYGVSRLYHNNGNGTFSDVAEKLGVARKGWSTGATFGDYDRDGRLDLFVPGYLEFDIEHPPSSPRELYTASGAGKVFCQFRGFPVLCGPRGLRGENDTLYHQRADGTFEDVSVKAGVQDQDRFYGLSSAFVHVNEDDPLDLIVVNDSTPKLLYINKGNGTFEEVGFSSGVALNDDGREQAGMGLGIGDYDNDGLIDFYITNFSDEFNILLHNIGDGNYRDVSFLAGQGDLTTPFLGWGTTFVDYDNDGWKDILAVNGHVYPLVDKHDWDTSYAQQPLLLRNLSNGKFERVAAAPNSGLALALTSRGLAVGDLDGDGLVDAVINNIDSPPTVLRNVTKTAGHWVSLKLVGDPAKKSPRDATGAIVYLTTGNLRQRQDVISGGGFASQNDRRLHFGLGAATRIDRLDIKWPGGANESVALQSVDREFTIVEGKGPVRGDQR